MMRCFFFALCISVFTGAGGQVLSTAPIWSFGVHFNPALTTPVLDGASRFDKDLRPVYVNGGWNTGFDLQYKTKEMTFATGINVLSKTFTIRQRLYHFSNLSGYEATRNNHFNIASKSISLEVPLLVSYCLHHHDKRLVYDIHAVAGASAELNNTTGYAERIWGNTGSIVHNDYTLPADGTKKIWVNAIAGFKIQAILRFLGLIDYGLIWHVPVQTNEPYMLTSEVKDYNTGTNKVLTGNYSPRLGYLDVKFCYYFLNLDEYRRRVKFRYKRDDEDKKK